MLGVLLVQKPLSVTSHDVVNTVRRKFGTRRVGHAGTLDPLATGLLVIAVGPATRFLQYLPLEPKEYIADVQFGRATTTYDLEGDSTFEGPVPPDLGAAIEIAKPKFLGLIEQVPPMYSAVKVKGKPLYAYARSGQEIERNSRRVHIGAFDVLELGATSAKVRIECSGGTYVRSLAHDMGEAVGCGAHLTGLLRTGVGRFRVEQGTPLEEIEPSLVYPLREALAPMPMVSLEESDVQRIRLGQPIDVAFPEEAKLVALLDGEGRVFSVARVIGNQLQPECVIPEEAMNGVR